MRATRGTRLRGILNDESIVRATLLENPRSAARSLRGEYGGGSLAPDSGRSLGAEPGGESAAEYATPDSAAAPLPPAPPASPERPGVLAGYSRACDRRRS